MQTKILYEDKDIIVVHKPAGIAVQTARIGQADVVSELKNYLAKSGRQGDVCDGMRKSGNRAATGSKQQVYLGVIHRLDQPVEGVLVFAKNQKAAAGLSKQLTEDDFCKEYIAIVCGQTPDSRQELVDYLAKEDGQAVVYEKDAESGALRRLAVGDQVTTATHEMANDKLVAPKKAVLHYERLSEKVSPHGTISLLKVQLQTGRFHQIRAQLSHAGTPILGDVKYGSAESVEVSKRLGIRNTALCACRLTFAHPVTGQKMEYTVTPANRAFALLEE